MDNTLRVQHLQRLHDARLQTARLQDLDHVEEYVGQILQNLGLVELPAAILLLVEQCIKGAVVGVFLDHLDAIVSDERALSLTIKGAVRLNLGGCGTRAWPSSDHRRNLTGPSPCLPPPPSVRG